MRDRIRFALLATSLAMSLAAAASPAHAFPRHDPRACLDGERSVAEASALRDQARQEARLGDHDRVCDTLDEVGDRYRDAQDAFRDCGETIAAIDLRSELRALRIAKHVNRCD